MRNVKKNLALLTSILVIFFTNQGCQYVSRQSNEMDGAVRVHHAKQLLEKNYSKSIVKEFEKDEQFSILLKRYIAVENANLDSDSLGDSLLQVSRDHFYDPVFLLAIVKTESQFNPKAIGLAGEIGLMQIKPVTAEWICNKKKVEWRGAEALKDPAYNVLVGALYFTYLKKSLKAKSAHYIAAYNMGINNLQRLPAGDRKNNPYYEKVLANYHSIYSELKKIRQAI